MRLIQIVPRLPPAVDGLGDYAFNLAVELRRAGVESVFIVGPGTSCSESLNGFQVVQLRARRGSALLETLKNCDRGDSPVLLHYVNYAYAKRGCPFWLIDSCRKWVAVPEHRLITLFHELFAVGPFWKSEFWLSGTQIRLAKQLHNLSSYSITTTELYEKQLRAWNGSKPVAVLPVFSNAGEPQELLPLLWRKRRAIVFGRRESRQHVYKNNLSRLAELSRSLNLQEIYDVGPRLGLNMTSIGETKLFEMGELPVEQISEIMRQSIAGIFDYDLTRLSKSGIYAAYCAHGLVPIYAGPSATCEYTGLLLSLEEAVKKSGIEHLSHIADAANRWYQTHTRRISAERIATLVNEEKLVSRAI